MIVELLPRFRWKRHGALILRLYEIGTMRQQGSGMRKMGLRANNDPEAFCVIGVLVGGQDEVEELFGKNPHLEGENGVPEAVMDLGI